VPYLGWVVRGIALSGLFGATFLLALISDLISFLTLHVFYFYCLAARSYAVMLHILSSFSKLFRGKKAKCVKAADRFVLI